jgi:hypothetical protein
MNRNLNWVGYALRTLQGFLLAYLISASSHAQTPLTLEVLNTRQTENVPRIGLNLGEWSIYGAAQLMRNVLKNPGFEGRIDRAVVIVAHADAQSFDDDTSWTGRPDGFWAGAHFDVRSGKAAGQSGTLTDSKRKGINGLPLFLTQGAAPALAPGDVIVIVLSHNDAQNLPSHWEIPRDLPAGQISIESKDLRPGTPGQRSLVLSPIPNTPPTRITAYFDSISDRAGKLLPFTGHWQFSIWAKAASPQATLRIRLQRAGSAPFLATTATPNTQWQLLNFAFDGNDQGPPGTVALELRADGGKILLDDVSLERMDGGSGAFRAEVVNALQQLKPGYLRDWQGQLGDSFANLTAPAFGRQTDRYRPGPEDRFGYGLPEFLDLCKQIGANPWVVLPTTLDDAEYEAYGHYLAERIRQDGFSEAIAEFGNENWNRLFRPAGIPNANQHGLVAQRAFMQFRKGAGNAPIRLAVNGQHVNPKGALNMLDATPAADLLAVAPYLLHEANRRDLGETPWPLLFKTDTALPQLAQGIHERGKAWGVYEVNLHTTRGDIPPAQRETITAGQAAGSALAKRLLEGLNLGAKQQCVYTFAQYDTLLEDRSFAKLWGITRDLGATGRLRPTGLSLAMLNSALPGDLYPVRISGPQAETLTAAAIRRTDGWALVLVSASAAAQPIEIKLPANSPAPHRLQKLDASSPAATN